MKQFFILLYVIMTGLLHVSDEYIFSRARRQREVSTETNETTTTEPATTEPTSPTRRTPPTLWTVTKKWVNLTLPRSIEKFYKQLGKWDGKKPDVGYEPYWVGHDWLMTEKKKKKSRKTKPGKTTLPPLPPTGMCGKRCPLRYRKYGEICARNKKNVFKSFKNLCAMNNDDCFGKIGWMIVYQGNCTHDVLPIFPTVTIHQHALQLLSNIYTTTHMTTINLEDQEVSSIDVDGTSSSESSSKEDGDTTTTTEKNLNDEFIG